MATTSPDGLADTPGTRLSEAELLAKLRQAERRVESLEAALDRGRELLAQKQRQLIKIHATVGWKVMTRLYAVRDRLFPHGSRRQRAQKWVMNQILWWYRRLGRRTPGTSRLTPQQRYLRWIATAEPDARAIARQREVRFAYRPRISVVVPTWNTPPTFLRDMVESVLAQTYPDWELCVADGGSADPAVRAYLDEVGGRDDRVRVVYLGENRGIVGNSQAALDLATGEFVALLDHDDTLAPFALFEIVRALQDHPRADVLYSDEDKLTADGTGRLDPHFKPDWSPDLMRSYNYLCHLTVYRRALLDAIGGFRPGFEGAQDYDLALRATERARAVVHVPGILYHWRVHQGSTAGDGQAKYYAYESGMKAVAEHLARVGLDGQVADGPYMGVYQVTYRLTARPLVSVIIPTKDLQPTLAKCLESVARSTYTNYEIVLAENGSRQPETFAYYRELGKRPNVRLFTWERSFNYAAINNAAARQARGEVLLFLNNDVEVINPDWLERMLEHAQRPGVGAVGAKLYYPDFTIQHAGVILGIGGVAGHAHRLFPGRSPGYCCRLVAIQNLTAVTAACLMIRREVFDEVGGFDEEFVLAFNDVDLCTRVHARGYRNVWTPFAELYHFESKTRGYEDNPEKQARFKHECDLYQARWGELLRAGDPCYNRHLSLVDEDFSVRLPSETPTAARLPTRHAA